MRPVLKGDLLPFSIHEDSLVYHQVVVYARCKSCTQPIPLGVGTTLQQKLKSSPQDITDGRSQAKELGLAVGLENSMIAHVWACGSITTAVFCVAKDENAVDIICRRFSCNFLRESRI
jgi:hypothetical protein